MSAEKDHKRIEELLRVCLEMLKRQDRSHYVLDVLSETFQYDETECDGYCLMEDIKHALGEHE